MLRHRFFRSKWLAFGWLLFISVLFVLPGSAFPQENFLSRIYFDKWVHIGLFAVLVFLWCSAFGGKSPHFNIMVISGALAYGIIVELVQERWVFSRSADPYDVMADMAGAFLGLGIWQWAKKNKPL